MTTISLALVLALTCSFVFGQLSMTPEGLEAPLLQLNGVDVLTRIEALTDVSLRCTSFSSAFGNVAYFNTSSTRAGGWIEMRELDGAWSGYAITGETMEISAAGGASYAFRTCYSSGCCSSEVFTSPLLTTLPTLAAGNYAAFGDYTFTPQITVEAWVTPTVKANGYMSIGGFSMASATSEHSGVFYSRDGNLRYHVKAGLEECSLASVTLDETKLSHFVYVLGATSTDVYVNGELLCTGALGVDYGTETVRVFLTGYGYNSISKNPNTNLDNAVGQEHASFRVYNRLLSTGDVSSLFADKSSAATPQADTIVELIFTNGEYPVSTYTAGTGTPVSKTSTVFA